jgi:ankyrin repeat protein
VKADSPEVVKVLLGFGAVVDLPNGYGRTPLHIAAEHNFADVAELLLSRGADFEVRDNGNESPLDRAQRANAVDVEAVLIAHGATQSRNGSGMGSPLRETKLLESAPVKMIPFEPLDGIEILQSEPMSERDSDFGGTRTILSGG